jgi:hypothetical protein
MRLARWIFGCAAIYGLLCLVPFYFLESTIARTTGPVTHPEYYYGFIGVAVSFNLLFVLIAREPVRLKPAMLMAVLEKVSFGAAVWPLHAMGRTPLTVALFASVDLALAALFLFAWGRTPNLVGADHAYP